MVLQPAALPGSVAATLFANYRFGDSANRIRPFVGVGVNYTVFDKTESTALNDAVNGGATTIKLKSSLGIERTSDITFKPTVLTLALGYSF